MDQTYMKQKPVLPLVVSMALPMTLSMLCLLYTSDAADE